MNNSRSILIAAMLGTLWFGPVVNAQESTLDQSQLAGNDQNRAIHSRATYGQTFTVGVTGTLSALELSVYSVGTDLPDLIVQVVSTSPSGALPGCPEGGITPFVLGEVRLPQSDLGPAPFNLNVDSVTGTLIDLSTLQIQVKAGDQLAFVLRSDVVNRPPDALRLYASRSEVFTDQYSDGVLLTGGGDPALCPIDHGDGTFKIFVNDCEPSFLDVQGMGFWKRVCKTGHPSGEHERISDYVDRVNAVETFRSVNSAHAIFTILSPLRKNDKCTQAESQFMALLLNVASGRVTVCSCVIDPDLGSATVGEVIDFIDSLLANPKRTHHDCVLAQSMAGMINEGLTLVECGSATHHE